MTTEAWRERIYSQYVNARDIAVAPASLLQLEARGAYLRHLIQHHFPKDRGASILDIGCGHGALIHIAKRMGYLNVSGVDASPEQVAAAYRLGIEGVTEGDLLGAMSAEADGSLDVVVAFDVIEHLSPAELLVVVDAVYRVLKPGGRWIVHVPNGESPLVGRMRYGDFTHELAFTRTSLTQILLSSNFSAIECFEDAPVVHGAKSAIRLVLWKMFRTMLKLYVAVETGDVAGKHIFSQNLLAVAFKGHRSIKSNDLNCTF